MKFKCEKCGKVFACELILTGEPSKPPTDCPYGGMAEWKVV